jgi:hypothetical protein
MILERHFPDDAEVDQWIASHFLTDADVDAGIDPIVDQLKAASSDVANRMRANAPGMVMDGSSQWAVFDMPDDDRSKVRGAVRQYLAAQSAGIKSLCEHVGQIRPLVLLCDPPVIVCTECMPSRMAAIKALGHFWDFQCDRCGAHVELLSATTIGGLGHVVISGHLCRRCSDGELDQALRQADLVMLVQRPGERGIHRGSSRRRKRGGR